MAEELNIITERVDDTPLLLAHMEWMDLPLLLDAHFPPHGNCQALSPGWTTTIWLAQTLSEGNHRLSYMQPWAEVKERPVR